MRFEFCGPLVLVAVLSIAAYSQTPFSTDDADVTDRGKFHLEFLNGYDVLQASARPSVRQNAANVSLAFGVYKNIEIGVDIPMLVIFNTEGAIPRHPFGVSDIGAHIKVRINEEKKGSRLPSFAIVLATRVPSGNFLKGLGSGITNYQLYGIAQKSLTPKMTLRANAGILFAGNTVVGALGLRTRSERLFSGSVSVTRQFTEKLRLGAEATAVVSRTLRLSNGQLQSTFGGNYHLTKRTSLDMGFVLGRFPASPRVAILLGFSHDF